VQIAPEVLKSPAAVTELMFNNCREFAERFVIFRDQKKWVIAETIGTDQIFNDPAPALAACFQPDIAIGVSHCKLADERCPSFFRWQAAKLIQHSGVIGCVVAMGACISGGVNAGPAFESINGEP
jgi:hypothetical protein